MIDLQHLSQRVAVRLCRAVGRPLFGNRIGEAPYEAIGRDLSPTATSPCEVTCRDPRDTVTAAALLKRHGIVVLPGLVDAALAAQARREIDIFIARLRHALDEPADCGVVEDIFWQVGGVRFPSYRALAAHDRPVVNLTGRRGSAPNAGIIDIFRVDQAARRHGWRMLSACCAELAAPSVAGLVAAVSSRRPDQFHLLRNDSITHTRRLHWDNLDGYYKAFLYLSPVTRPDDGAYAYVPGSHRRLDLIRREARLNSLTGRREQDSFSFAGREIAILGDAGTVIVSCQDGVHRGLPQRPGATRSMLVCNYHR
jgi:hypothetical protein